MAKNSSSSAENLFWGFLEAELKPKKKPGPPIPEAMHMLGKRLLTDDEMTDAILYMLGNTKRP